MSYNNKIGVLTEELVTSLRIFLHHNFNNWNDEESIREIKSLYKLGFKKYFNPYMTPEIKTRVEDCAVNLVMALRTLFKFKQVNFNEFNNFTTLFIREQVGSFNEICSELRDLVDEDLIMVTDAEF